MAEKPAEVVIQQVRSSMDGGAFEFSAKVLTHGEPWRVWGMLLYTTPDAPTQVGYTVGAEGLFRAVNTSWLVPHDGLEVLEQHGSTLRLRISLEALGNPSLIRWRFIVNTEEAGAVAVGETVPTLAGRP